MGSEAIEFGEKPLLITDRNMEKLGNAARVKVLLEKSGIEGFFVKIKLRICFRREKDCLVILP